MSRGEPLDTHKKAIRFILFFGAVSLFADVTYEGARSITGPFLELLGAGAAVVGLVIGLGEFVGYGLRLFTGWLADRTGWYWGFILLGYAVNLLAVPLIGLAESWQLAAALIITERLGKAIRTPARDAVLSQATAVTGHGKGFGLHEAMDQVGAVLGPLILSGVFFADGSYSTGFAILAVPALFSLIFLVVTRFQYPNPQNIHRQQDDSREKVNPRFFIYYLFGIGFIALGFADFPLLAYHFKAGGLMADRWIPIAYALAMGTDAIAGLVLGTLFDKWRRPVIVIGVLISSAFAPLVFLGTPSVVIIGVIVWGIGMGLIESVLRASVAHLIPPSKRGWAYGLFNGVFGLAWFAGSAAAGYLYEIQLWGMVLFLVLAQLLALPFLWKAFAQQRN